ncbi:MAG: AAA family ATPase, partial [Bacteroidia bacterium]
RTQADFLELEIKLFNKSIISLTRQRRKRNDFKLSLIKNYYEFIQKNFKDSVSVDNKLVFSSDKPNNQSDYFRILLDHLPATEVYFRYLIESNYVAPRLVTFFVPRDIIGLDSKAKINFDKSMASVENQSSLEIINHFISEAMFFLSESEFEFNERSINELKNGLLKVNIGTSRKKALNTYCGIDEIRISPKCLFSYSDKSDKDEFGGGWNVENVFIEFLVNNNWLEWNDLSDGTKRLFYLTTEILFQDHGIFFVEEPELGIHPHQFAKVMEFLKEQSKDKQIIISTHSPQALDVLDEDELDRIIICEYVKNEGTKLRHLTKAEKAKASDYINEIGFLRDYWIMSDLEG